MNTSRPIGEVDLHSLIDREIAADEKAELHAALRDDETLTARVYEVAHHKDLVRLAYADVNPSRTPRAIRRRVWAAAASIVIAALLLVSGIQFLLPEPLPTHVVLLDLDGSGQQLADPNRNETRIVMHLKGEEMARTGEVLDELEAVLEAFRQEFRPIRIELVAQGEGLDLLREGFSRHTNQIRDLAPRFDNLTFVACQNSIDRINRDQGIEVNLLPQAIIISSGVSHVAKRQVQGWAYIHI